MRDVLAALGVINLIAAVLILGAGKSFYAATVLHWSQRHGELIESGALIERPDVAGGTTNNDWWLMRELLPAFEERTARMVHVVAVGLAAQGVILLILAFSQRQRTVSKPPLAPCWKRH